MEYECEHFLAKWMTSCVTRCDTGLSELSLLAFVVLNGVHFCLFRLSPATLK
jgi:hypothetical protein